MSGPQSVASYRAMVRNAHSEAFAIHGEVATTLEPAVITTRVHPGEVAHVLDMLMVKGYKAHPSVHSLAEHGLLEDAATIARRLLELSIQAVYIGAEDDLRERQRRAGRYLAFLWRSLPRRFREEFPATLKAEWSGYAQKYGRLIPKKAKAWGPRWDQMFKAAGLEKLYKTDYRLLSAIAHGSPDEQVFTFSQSTVQVHAHHHASALLVFASKYYLVIAEQWNGEYGLIDAATLEGLIQKVVEWEG